MCTTYTWLAYQLPERAGRGGRQPPRLPEPCSGVARTERLWQPPAVPMPCIREEDEMADDEAEAACRLPRRRRARHWVGLAIVGVQMAAWCLVGALLMHRGVSNLRRRDAALLRAAAAAAVVPATTSTTSTGSPPWTLHGAEPSPVDDALGGEEAEVTTADPEDDDDFPEDSRHDLRTKSWSSYVPMRPSPGLVAPREDVPRPPPAPADHGAGPGPRPVAGTGAATAVVMVTVGGVMLVVGPAFMAIKISDVYQRQKRLGKLSQHDDPPPSYDEVAEKAPRYSALFQVLENGELSALPLALPLALPAERQQAPSEDACTPTTPDAVDGCGVAEEDEQEPDASTPLRHEEGTKPRQQGDDKTRRKSV